MVDRLKRVLGRTELRLLVVLALCVAICLTLASRAQGPKPSSTTLNTWNELVLRSSQSLNGAWPLVVPQDVILPEHVEDGIVNYGLAGLQALPYWFWGFDLGVAPYAAGSEIAAAVTSGTRVVVYEDMAAGTVGVVSVDPNRAPKYETEKLYQAPLWQPVEAGDDLGDYLFREVSKRRVVATLTLVAESEYTAARAARGAEQVSYFGFKGGAPATRAVSSTNPLEIAGMRMVASGLELRVEHLTSLAGTTWSVYAYEAPDMEGEAPFSGLAGIWAVVSSNLVLTGSTVTTWTDTRPMGLDANGAPVHRFYALGNNGVDGDGDGLSDALEQFVHKTNPSLADTDGDGLSDGAESALGTDPFESNAILAVGNMAIEYQPCAMTRGKCGFQDFLGGNRYYRRLTGSGQWSFTEQAPGATLAEGGTFDCVVVYDSACNINLIVGDATYLWDSDDEECHSTFERLIQWTNAAATEYVQKTDEPPNCGIGNSSYSVTVAPPVTAQSVPWPCGDPCEVVSGVERRNEDEWSSSSSNGITVNSAINFVDVLGDEFTTEELLDGTLAALDSLCIWSPTNWSISPSDAYRILSEDETTLAVQRVKYRFHVPATIAGAVYRLTWVEIVQPTNETHVSYIDETYSVLFAGTGSDVYIGAVDEAEPYAQTAGVTGDFTIEPPATNATARVSLLMVEMKEPDGLPRQNVGSGDAVFRFNPSCFEWQYVHPNNVVVPYSQSIEGLVEPNSSPFGYFWSVSAGSLSGADTATPAFSASGMSVPSTMSQVTLTLCPKADCSVCTMNRTLEVYRDHLERDYENFGTGIECGAPISTFYWSFTRYSTNIWIPHSWNCFGSVWHAFDGTHDGAVNDSVPSSGFTVTTYDDPIPWSTALAGLGRGDIVSFYTYNSGTGTETWQHAHTCLGSASQMYGANNQPIYGVFGRSDGHGHSHVWEGGSFKWWVTSSETYYNEMNTGYQSVHPGAGLLINRIKVHRR